MKGMPATGIGGCSANAEDSLGDTCTDERKPHANAPTTQDRPLRPSKRLLLHPLLQRLLLVHQRREPRLAPHRRQFAPVPLHPTLGARPLRLGRNHAYRQLLQSYVTLLPPSGHRPLGARPRRLRSLGLELRRAVLVRRGDVPC